MEQCHCLIFFEYDWLNNIFGFWADKLSVWLNRVDFCLCGGFFALGLIGAITLACLSSASAFGIGIEERSRRIGVANVAGIVLVCLNVLLSIAIGVVGYLMVL